MKIAVPFHSSEARQTLRRFPYDFLAIFLRRRKHQKSYKCLTKSCLKKLPRKVALARKLTAWRGSDRWSESEIYWNEKRKVSGIERSPPTPETPRNCGRCSTTSNGKIVLPHPRRPTFPQRRCQDSSRTRSGQCVTILPQQMHRPSPS